MKLKEIKMNYSEWLNDFSVNEASEWNKFGFSYEEAMEWSFEEFSPEDAGEWISYGFDFKLAIKWSAKGYAAREARMYIDMGYPTPSNDIDGLISEKQIESWDLRN